MSVVVGVRVRPFNEAELSQKAECIVSMKSNEVILTTPFATKSENHVFHYDHAYWSIPSMTSNDKAFASQEVVYKDLGSLLLKHTFDGYNATLFAYGQTSSGKTYSMMGTAENPGLIPRVCRGIFERAAAGTDGFEVRVEVSFLEIYCEKVRCLLNPTVETYATMSGLKVREHPITGPYVEGLASIVVHNHEDILRLMDDGNKIRTTAATGMNSVSSRSHALFSMVVTQEKKSRSEEGVEVTTKKVSKLNLVDLAGSERVAKTHATGTRLTEGANINKSLCTLGIVISNLSDGVVKGHHIPYRDSVLTWLLKEALGGNSKTVMLATVSPAALHFEETLSTLRYAERAKKIMNKAVVNEDSTNRMVTQLQNEIDKLRSMLGNQQNSKEETERLSEELKESTEIMTQMKRTWEEREKDSLRVMDERQHRIDSLVDILKQKDEHIEELEEELSIFKAGFAKTDAELQTCQERIRELEERTMDTQSEKESMQLQLHQLFSQMRELQKKYDADVQQLRLKMHKTKVTHREETASPEYSPRVVTRVTDLSTPVANMVQRLGKTNLTQDERDLLSYANIKIIAKVIDALEHGEETPEDIWRQLLQMLKSKRGTHQVMEQTHEVLEKAGVISSGPDNNEEIVIDDDDEIELDDDGDAAPSPRTELSPEVPEATKAALIARTLESPPAPAPHKPVIDLDSPLLPPPNKVPIDLDSPLVVPVGTRKFEEPVAAPVPVHPPTTAEQQPQAPPQPGESATNILDDELAPPGAWNCEKCTYLNKKPHAPVCEMCGYARASPVEGSPEFTVTSTEGASDDVSATMNVGHFNPIVNMGITAEQAAKANAPAPPVMAPAAPTTAGVSEHTPTDHGELVMRAEEVPNFEMLQYGFKVSKWNPENGFLKKALKKERVWEIDFYNRRFVNYDLNGVRTFDYPSNHLYRIERHYDNNRMLRLMFFKAPHPYDLLFPNTEKAIQFLELSLALRRAAFMWSPRLCPDAFKDVTVTINRPPKVKILPAVPGQDPLGNPVLSVTRMPYEVVRIWTGMLSLNNKLPPADDSVFQHLIPRTGYELYALGLQDIAPQLRGTKGMTEYFQRYFGNLYFPLICTQSEVNSTHAYVGSSMIILMVKRRHILRMANIEAIDIGDYPIPSDPAEKAACAVSLRYNDTTMMFVMFDIRPSFQGAQVTPRLLNLFMRVNIGQSGTDISSRFDNIFVLGYLNYTDPFTEQDGLAQEVLSGHVLTEFREGTPDASLMRMPLPQRILCWYRQKTCKIQPAAYYAVPSPFYGNNVAGVYDVYTLRVFLGALMKPAPCQILLRQLTIQGKAIPNPRDGELVLSAEWMEGSPYTIPVKFKDGALISLDECIPPIRPINTSFEFLRVQHILFTLQGFVEGDKQKQVLASGSVPLKMILSLGKYTPFMCLLCKATKAMGVLSGELGWMTEKRGVQSGITPSNINEHNCVIIISAYENEVMNPSTKSWVGSTDPPRYTALDGVTPSVPQTIQTPDTDWIWVSDWQVKKRKDAEGWMYASGFSEAKGSWTESDDITSLVRRRHWYRMMRCLDESKYRTVIASKGPAHSAENDLL